MSAPENEPTPAGRRLEVGRRILDDLLAPMKEAFVGKDTIIDLMGLCLVAGENLFILGPPGTAKSALVNELGRRLHGRTFEYLLTRFTEPNELFGPFDIRRLREGVLETNTEGMLPEADLVFLDELLNANSAILNSLLTVLNERWLRRGREHLALPLLMAVGASNHLPEDDALGALFDRFLVRVVSANVAPESLPSVLAAGWKLEGLQIAPAPVRRPAGGGGSAVGEAGTEEKGVDADDVRELRTLLPEVALAPVLPAYTELVSRLRQVGIEISDRRAVKIQRLLAASALLCGRLEAEAGDLWVLKHIWDVEEQQELLEAAVSEVIDGAGADAESKGGPADGPGGDGGAPRHHPQATRDAPPDPEQLAREFDLLEEDIAGREGNGGDAGDGAVAEPALRDRLALLEERCQFVANAVQREALTERVGALWNRLPGRPTDAGMEPANPASTAGLEGSADG